MTRKARRAGDTWRILAQGPDGPHDLSSDQLPGTEFDELVVGQWIHLEQMDTNSWWMNIGGVTVWVRATRNGKAREVSVYGPNDYAEPVDGCKYSLTWNEPPSPVPAVGRPTTKDPR